jgi:hypothetical protein
VKKNKWENLASANIKKVIGAMDGKLEEALAVWIGQLMLNIVQQPMRLLGK